MEQPGLYIHVPFCRTKCGYCVFYSVTSLRELPEYIKALLEEITFYTHKFKSFDTIYFGGGTPSLLPIDAFSTILGRLRDTFSIAADAEITVEVNPADAQPHFLTGLRQLGVNRLNLGIQSFDAAVLRFLGRRHTGQQALRSVERARHSGFDNLGLDLIYGIPDQPQKAWKDTLLKALSCEPDHLSCYELSLEGDTPLGLQYRRGDFALPDEREQRALFETTADLLENAGYLHYEVSSFARDESRRSRHNRKYWHHVPYLGIGPAAHSHSGQNRWWNHGCLKQYLLDLRRGRPPVGGSERISSAEKRLEACFLGLRTSDGVSLKHLTVKKHMPPGAEAGNLFEELVRRGFFTIRDGCLKPTRSGMAVADRLALML